MDQTNNLDKTDLESNGWEKKFTIEDHRVQEYVELYQSLGKEVRVEPVIPSEMDGCSSCFKTTCTKYKVIYTRSKQK